MTLAGSCEATRFITLIGSAAALPLLREPVARAKEPGRIYRLGILTGAARQAPRMVGFFDELKVFGFVEGQNLNIVAGGFDLRDDQFAEVAPTLAKAAPHHHAVADRPVGEPTPYLLGRRRHRRRRIHQKEKPPVRPDARPGFA